MSNQLRSGQKKAGKCKPSRNTEFSVICRNDVLVPMVEAFGERRQRGERENDSRGELEDALRH